jgi:LacI family transcriptional regulator
MSQPLRIALLIESSRSYGRNLLSGIAAYGRVYGPWVFYHEERSLGDPLPAALKQWRPQGILARMENRTLIRKLRRLGVPTVDLLHEEGMPGIPGVISNGKAIVQLAIDHLRQLRLKHFAYCGLPNVVFSDQRCRHFVRGFAALGYRVDVFAQRRSARARGLANIERNARSHADALAAWLRTLPKPVGLMACNDMRAFQVLSVCREAGILVPDEVAVIGVDNDPVQCELCNPPLSSVDNNAQRVGYQAAALLHRMIQRRGAVPRRILVKPIGVVARRSTDVLAVANRETIEIVRYIHDHACEGLTPARLARQMAMSRSTLERRFAQYLGHSVNREILRVRLNRVKELLITSNLTLGEIARLAGFSYVETMQRTFKNREGQTPGQYRNCRRIAGAAGNLR